MNSLFCLNSIRPVSRLAEIKRCPDKSLKADKETNSLRLFCFGLNYFPGSRAIKNWQSFLHFEIKEEWLWLAAYLHRNGSCWLEWLVSLHFYRALGGSTWISSALIVSSGTAFPFKVNCIRDNMIWGESVCTSQSLLPWGLSWNPQAGGYVGATTASGIQGFSVESFIEDEALFTLHLTTDCIFNGQVQALWREARWVVLFIVNEVIELFVEVQCGSFCPGMLSEMKLVFPRWERLSKSWRVL